MAEEDIRPRNEGESDPARCCFDIAPEIREMFESAEKKGEQPICIYCGGPLEIGQTFYTDVLWRWDPDTKRYEKLQDDSADCDKPYCIRCGAKDWDFTNNKWVQY